MQLERKMTALEGERDVLKNLLNQAQKERDDLMRQVNRLHSQGIFFQNFNTNQSEGTSAPICWRSR